MAMLKIVKNKDLIMIWAATFLAAIIFSSWHFLPIFFGVAPQTFFISSSSSFFQSLQSWQPLINSVAQGNSFPAAPNVNDVNGFYFYPYLALWFCGLILQLLGENGEMLFGQLIFPTACFALIVKIFLRHLSVRWSVAIAFLSTMSFSTIPFRQFLMGLICGKNLSEISTLQPLEILHFPFPSLSLLVFLAIYFLCTKQIKLTKKRITNFTILWALSTQIHLPDAFFGLIFWFTYFPIRFFRQEKLTKLSSLIPHVVQQLLLALILALPALFLVTHNVSDLGIITENNNGVGLYYYFFYFLTPIVGCVLAYFIFRIDVYEILLKFWHIYVLMAAELILISIVQIFDIGTGIEMVKNRIPLFFLHFYYYVPIVYFATRPLHHEFKKGVESKRIITVVRSVAVWCFNDFSKVYLPLLSILLIVFPLNSSYRHFNYYKLLQEVAVSKINTFKKVDDELATVKSQTIAFADPVMINFAVAKSYKTLWVNHFSNNIDRDEIILRVALHAKIFSWKKEEFIRFMSRGKLQEGQGEIIDLSQDVTNLGIGYWLVFHKKILSTQDEQKYQEKLGQIFDKINLKELLKKYEVTYVVSNLKPDLKGIKLSEVSMANEVKIFKIYE